MRVNPSVTKIENQLRDGTYIVSRTKPTRPARVARLAQQRGRA